MGFDLELRDFGVRLVLKEFLLDSALSLSLDLLADGGVVLILLDLFNLTEYAT